MPASRRKTTLGSRIARLNTWQWSRIWSVPSVVRRIHRIRNFAESAARLWSKLPRSQWSERTPRGTAPDMARQSQGCVAGVARLRFAQNARCTRQRAYDVATAPKIGLRFDRPACCTRPAGHWKVSVSVMGTVCGTWRSGISSSRCLDTVNSGFNTAIPKAERISSTGRLRGVVLSLRPLGEDPPNHVDSEKCQCQVGGVSCQRRCPIGENARLHPGAHF